MNVRGSRRNRIKGAAALAGAAVLAITMGACGNDSAPTDPHGIVDRFTRLLDKKDATGAADLTSYPSGADASLKQIFGGLNSGKPDYQIAQYIGLDATTAMFNLKADWNFGPGKDWSFDLQGSIRKLAIGWRISWDPSVVMPQLDSTRTVKLVRTDATPAPRVDDNTGAPLMTQQNINVITLDPARMPDPVASTNALADAISPVAPLITGPSLLQQLSASQGKPITAVSLRDDDFAILQPRMAAIPGVVMLQQPQLVVADRRVWSPLTDAYKKVWQDNRTAHAGWGVQLFGPDGKLITQLAGQQGPPGPDIAATMDQKLQRAAEDAVVSVGTAASIVAIQPSTGAVVAAAQNNQASAQGSPAFTSAYPAGGNMDLFRAAAGILGNKAPQDVSVQDAAKAATRLGVGIGFQVPGLDETTGRRADHRARGRTGEGRRLGSDPGQPLRDGDRRGHHRARRTDAADDRDRPPGHDKGPDDPAPRARRRQIACDAARFGRRRSGSGEPAALRRGQRLRGDRGHRRLADREHGRSGLRHPHRRRRQRRRDRADGLAHVAIVRDPGQLASHAPHRASFARAAPAATAHASPPGTTPAPTPRPGRS